MRARGATRTRIVKKSKNRIAGDACASVSVQCVLTPSFNDAAPPEASEVKLRTETPGHLMFVPLNVNVSPRNVVEFLFGEVV